MGKVKADEDTAFAEWLAKSKVCIETGHETSNVVNLRGHPICDRCGGSQAS
jgi:hypothetical protein